MLESSHPDITEDAIEQRRQTLITQQQQIAAHRQVDLPDQLAASERCLAALSQRLAQLQSQEPPPRRWTWAWAKRRARRALQGSPAALDPLIQALAELTQQHQHLLAQTTAMHERLRQSEQEAWHLSARLNAFEARAIDRHSAGPDATPTVGDHQPPA
jgi:chromosome segregation ATPase